MLHVPFNYYTVSCFITAVTSFSLFFIVFSRNSRSWVNRSFSLFSLAVSFWSFNLGFALGVERQAEALLFHRLLMMGAIFVPTTLFHFVCLLVDKYRQHKKYILAAYGASLFFVLTNFTPLFISGVSKKAYFAWFEDPGPLYHPFFAMFAGLVGYSLFLLWKGCRQNVGSRSNQIRYVYIGFLIGFSGGATSFLLVYNIPVPPIGVSLVSVYIFMVAFAIVRYRLMDVHVVLTRGGIFVGVYLALFSIPIIIGYKYGLFRLALLLAVGLAVVAPILYRWVVQRAEKVLLREKYCYQRALQRLGREMLKIRKDEDFLYQQIGKTLYEEIVPLFVCIYSIAAKRDAFLKRCSAPENFVCKEALSVRSAVIDEIQKTGDPIFLEHKDVGLKRSVGHEVLVVPLFVREQVHGFILLGPKSNQRVYDADDLSLFKGLSAQVSLAVENILFAQEFELAQQIKRQRALDHYSSSIAHEVLNPVTCAISSIESMRLFVDDMRERLGDDNWRRLDNKLTQVVSHQMRIKDMIDSVKEFSGRASGKKVLVALDEVFKSFFVLFRPQVKSQGVVFTHNVEPGIHVLGDKIRLEQVLLNLGTNAVHAVCRDRQVGERKIHLEAKRNNNGSFMISVQDNGYGIRKDLLEDIFFDFVTTKASSVGTGMGLSLARKIVGDYGGRVWAESPGVDHGATFIVLMQEVDPKDVKETE